VTPTTSLTARAGLDVARATLPAAVTAAPAVVLDRVAKGMRGARARTGLTEAGVVAILERQGIALSVAALRRAETTGAIPLALASCLADVYGTTVDRLAGRRCDRKRPSLDAFPTE
jgi:hypothetical protein